MKKSHIVVIGAGLAGLAAAYELSKNKDCRVTVLERRSYAGGRVHSAKIQSHHIDLGGFIIYPWYKQYHRLIDELNIRAQLTPLPKLDILYDVDGSGTYIAEQDIPFPALDKLRGWSRSIVRLLAAGPVHQPDLHRFKGQTISVYLRQSLGKPDHAGIFETFFDIVNQGFCYGPVDEVKASLMAPITREITLHGNLDDSFYFPQGSHIFPEALAQAITKNGGDIQYNTEVQLVEQGRVTTQLGTIDADAVIFAQTAAPLPQGDNAQSTDNDCTYTQFAVCTFRFNELPIFNENPNWGSIFFKPDPAAAVQILSVINLGRLYHRELDGYVTANIRLIGKDVQVNKTNIKQSAKTDIARIFPDVTLQSIAIAHHWQETMPIAQEAFVERVRNAQGVNNYFYAGDYLGAPSMETAVATGVDAAQACLERME